MFILYALHKTICIALKMHSLMYLSHRKKGKITTEKLTKLTILFSKCKENLWIDFYSPPPPKFINRIRMGCSGGGTQKNPHITEHLESYFILI